MPLSGEKPHRALQRIETIRTRAGSVIVLGRSRASRAAASLVDQGLSSLANFLILFVALRTLPLRELGYFTLLYNGVFLVLSLVRPLALEPLVVRFSASSDEERDSAASQATGVSLIVGGACIAAGLFAALVFQGPLSKVFVLIGFTVTAALLQDAWRLYFPAAKRSWSAALNDGVCLVVTAISLILLWDRVAEDLFALLGVWTFGTSVGAVFGILQTRIIPQTSRSLDWIRATRGLGLRFAGEVALDRLGAQLSLFVIGLVAGAAALGQVGGTRTLMSPVFTVVSGAAIFLVPEAARMAATGDTRKLLGLSTTASLLLGLGVLLFTAVLIQVPASVGAAVVGDNWHSASLLLVPVGIWTAAAASRYGPRSALRALEMSSLTLKLAWFTSLTLVLCTAIGSYYGDAGGAAWGFALSHVLGTCLWWLAAGRNLLDRTKTGAIRHKKIDLGL